MDRIAPTFRPERAAVMFQRWSALGFLHWPIPAEALRAHVPAPLSIDVWEGQAWVGLVPFTVSGARPAYLPAVRGVSAFHEINVRTYVHLRGRDPGVWFFSLDANRPVVVALARALFHLAYQDAEIAFRRDGDRIHAAGTRPLSRKGPEASWSLWYEPNGTPAPAAAGSLEHFLAERYVLYAASGDRLYQGRVHHAPYPLQAAEACVAHESLVAAAGLVRPAAPPLHVHYAAGVDVEIFAPTRVA